MFFSVALFLFFTAILVERLRYPGEKLLLVIVSLSLVASAVYHTVFFGNRRVIRAQVDHEGLYYPEKVTRISKISLTVPNSILPIMVFRGIRKAFPDRYFFEGFFLVCMVCSSIFLISCCMYLRLQAAFGVSRRCSFVYFFIFCNPYLVARCALPGPNVLIIFFTLLFFYSIYFNAPLYLKISLCLSLYFVHKIFYIPVGLCLLYFLSKFPSGFVKKFVVIVFALFIMQCCCKDYAPRVIKIVMNYESRSILNSGKSYIPPSPFYTRILNFYLAPFWLNFTSFFCKSKEGNLFAWIFAILTNFCILFLIVRIFFLCRYYSFLPLKMRELVHVAIIFITAFLIEGVWMDNYLNCIRHAVQTHELFLLILLALEFAKHRSRSNSN